MKSEKIIKNICPISIKSIDKFQTILSQENISKGGFLVKNLKQNNKEYLVQEGVCRSFVYSPEGKEITLSFFMEGDPISPNLTRTKNNLSTINIQALTDVEILLFSNENLMQLMTTNNEIKQWGDFVLQRELFQKVEKELALASMTAKERLLLFRQKYRMLENLIPHTYIASYLGITPISLSRLRKELAEK